MPKRRSHSRNSKTTPRDTGIFQHWVEAQKIRAQTQLIKAQHRLQQLTNKHYWDQVRHERRKAFVNGVKAIGKGIGKGIKAARDLAREGSRAVGKGVKSASRVASKAAKGIDRVTKPYRDGWKLTQERNKRLKEHQTQARREFERRESLRLRDKAAPDGIKTKPTSDAVRDAVQRARQTSTTVTGHNRTRDGKSHQVGEHDRKLNPQEQDRQVADDLLKQGKKTKKEPPPELKALQERAKEAKASAAKAKREMEAERRKLDKIKSQKVEDHPEVRRKQAELDRLRKETEEINRKTRSAKASRPRKVTSDSKPNNVVNISNRISQRNGVHSKEPKPKSTLSWRDEVDKGDAS